MGKTIETITFGSNGQDGYYLSKLPERERWVRVISNNISA